MSDMFEDEDPQEEPRDQRTRPRRSRAIWITLVILIGLFLGFTAFTAVWTERLWFESLGYSGVFTKLIRTRVGLFVVFGLLMALMVGVNMAVAYRFRPVFRPSSSEQVSLDRYRQSLAPIRVWVLAAVAVVIGGFAGFTAAGKWREYLLWRNGVPFDQKDPYFDKDIGFYVFDLPWYHFVVDFLMAATLVGLIVAAIVHYLYGGIRLQSQDRLSGAATAQLSVLFGLFVLSKSVDYYLDRFDLLNEKSSLFTGMGYTDDHAVLPAKNILMFIALICALLFFANVIRRTWLLPSVGTALLVLSAILLGMVWPGIVQQFQVEPSQADKEQPYLEKNIDATRTAYDIADAKVEPFSGTTQLTAKDQRRELDNAPGIRLVDPSLVRATFEQLQQVNRYYSVAPVLDVDRYTVNGKERDVVIAARELDQSGMPDDAKNWSNLHTVYTHGSGVIAAYGNQRDANGNPPGANAEGALAWAESLGDSSDDAKENHDLTGGDYRSAIYYGESSPDYSIVGKADPDDRDVELDLGSEGNDTGTTTYAGKGGVDVGNTFQQFLYAWKFGEPNIVLSGRVNENSKILYNRHPREMVEKVAPWLTIDQDPFPAVVDGKVVWILDGYTTTDQYPMSERESFDEMTSDSLKNNNEFRTLPTDEINYMRNAVKATVDAYDGTVTLYAWDESDPMLKAWRKAFPGSIKDKDEIPESLLNHMRYPQDLFKVQRYQLAKYHVTNAKDFYEGNDRWEVPEDPNQAGQMQPPYRLSVRATSNKKADPVFSLTSVYVPYKKQNLAAFVSVDSDASKESYGQIRMLELPETTQIDGPGQVANQFGSNTRIQNQLAKLTRNANVRVVYGNLLTLPVGESLLYVQPLYAIRGGDSEANYPVLRYVLVSFGNRAAIGTTMREAVGNVLGAKGQTGGETPPVDAGDDEGGDDGGEGGNELPQIPEGTFTEQVSGLLDKADAQFDKAQQALEDGDLAAYQKANQRAEQFVRQALELVVTRETS